MPTFPFLYLLFVRLSLGPDLNRRPAHYEYAALTWLSYRGVPIIGVEPILATVGMRCLFQLG